ncbi:MAG: 23S rRNA (uracil(1939)-C(5))-methyltransferase RlmD [Candidatus Woesearchaeota archaeon]
MSAKCPLFGTCGGCSSQHIPYDLQLDNKKEMLQRIVGFEPEVLSDDPYSYRNRMDLIFHKGGLGFRKKGDWKSIVPVASCPISNDGINRYVQEVSEFFEKPDYFDLQKQTGTMKYCVIRTASSGTSISFVLNRDSTKIEQVTKQIETFAKETRAENILVTYVSKKTDMSISDEYYVIKGNDYLEQSYCGNRFRYSVQGFFQNNHVMAEKMHEAVRSIFSKEDAKDAELLDLYGGVGTFGINNAHFFSKVYTLESFAACTVSAKENIALNKVSNVSAHTMDAKNVHKIATGKKVFCITDPPRAGMHRKAIERLLEKTPELIVYISCNIMQLGKELPHFKGYTIEKAVLFDLFPQTPHCEGLVVLRKQTNS